MKDYKSIYNGFKWDIPPFFNIAHECCDKHAAITPNKVALIYEDQQGSVTNFTFSQISELSNRFANALKNFNMVKGDRLGILLSQQPETLITHLAGYKSGFINVPLFVLFGPEALKYRIQNSGIKILVLNYDDLEKVLSIKDELPCLEKVIVVGGGKGDDFIKPYSEVISSASTQWRTINTLSEDPALIIYTSGTTGPPKGALHCQRVLLGHLPGIDMSHNFFPKDDDRFWTPADWAWIGGLYDVLFPSLYFGIPVVAKRMKKFLPDEALRFIEKHSVKNLFMPPTALKMLRNIKNIKSKYKISLRTIASGGESLGEETLLWCREELGLDINEFYGQTEANIIVSNCSEIFPVKPSSMGKAVFGHNVKIIDSNGNELPFGVEGEIAVKSPDPVMFLGYWQNSDATEKKFINGWLRTGDIAKLDEDGYFLFSGRDDDIISSGGYRIGPSEIEDCLLKHPSVSLAAAIGKPDKVRGEIVKAFIVLKDGFEPLPQLQDEIKNFVKNNLAAHEYPREIEFTSTLPMTITGKIIRKELRRKEIERVKRKGGE